MRSVDASGRPAAARALPASWNPAETSYAHGISPVPCRMRYVIRRLSCQPSRYCPARIRPLGDHDIPNQGRGVGLHVEDTTLASGGLILLNHNDVAFCFDAFDLLVLLGAGLAWGRLCRSVIIVEDDERLAAHGRIAWTR